LTAGKHNQYRFLAYTLSLLICAPAALSSPPNAAADVVTKSSTASNATTVAPTASAVTATSSADAAPETSATAVSTSGAGSSKSTDTKSNATATDIKSNEDKNVEASGSDDVILRAFKDELMRTQTKLTLGGHPPPYFTAYTGHEQEQYNIYGSFGALDRCDEAHARWITVDLRAGDRKFDSDSGPAFFGGDGSQTTSLDDNYDAIRHDLWLRTDFAYKHAIEGLESKRAVLQQKKINDLPDAMSPAPPVVSLMPRIKLNLDREKWNREIKNISAVFKNYPGVLNSEVSLLSCCLTRWYANSEGSINREVDRGAVLGMTAAGQAPDGMDVADFEMIATGDPAALPDPAFLKTLAQSLAERVTALAKAPEIEDYRGPVLFEKQAAAEFFAQSLTPSLVNPNERLSRLTAIVSSGGLKEKLGRRILPTSVTVTDDPTAVEYKGTPLKGGYAVDDEGVKGEKVVLVQNGILKTLLSGRTPSRYVKGSNGHWHGSAPGPSILFVTSTEGKPLGELKAQLMRMGKEDGLKYVLIARRITTLYVRYFNAGEPGFKSLRGGYRSDQSIAPPTLLYKVNVDDGSEELVRGAKFEHTSSRMWRDIVAFGDDTQAYNVLNAGNPSNGTSSSLISPSILVSEMDVTRAQQEGEKPMFLKNPYFDKSIMAH
jgi:predicted Zn-dependent protease